MEGMQAAAVAFAVVAVAELGDKTQLLLLTMAARGSPLRVWLGACAGFALLTVLAVAAGGLVERHVPDIAVAVAVASVFLAYGVLLLIRRDPEDQPGPDVSAPARAGFLPAFAAMAVGELGDKTQLATAALGAGGHPVATGVGAFAALAASAALAVAAGRWLGQRIRPGLVRTAAAIAFLAVGAYAAFEAARLL